MVEFHRFRLVPGTLSIDDLRAFWREATPLDLEPGAAAGIEAAAETIAKALGEEQRVYGVNTGFGSLAQTSITDEDIVELQRRLVLSHSAGVGPPLAPAVVRLVLLLKINALARGYSGVRPQVIDALIALLNAEALPVIPSRGSVGASGDLAPLAHLAAVLLGEGEVRFQEADMPATWVLEQVGLEPLELAAKEGLALLNGTQVSTAIALDALFRARNLFAAALVAGALSVDAALGSDNPFDPRIQQLRGQPGQTRVARVLRQLLSDSEIRASHLACERVQDPYSLRCQPQVMGAVLDILDNAEGILACEANAVTDNPLVFPDEGEILSGGNFHAQPVAFAADVMALALAEIGTLSERRTALLTDARMSELPPFLVAEAGLNSGFMIAQVVAAALASENKALAHPRSVDSLPTSANQEDHVSMATGAALRLGEMAENAQRIVAIELLAAAQGVELRSPLETSPALREAMGEIRSRSAFLAEDRSLTPDIERIAELVESGWFHDRLLSAHAPLEGT